MTAEEALFSGTLVLVPVWLGAVQYIVKERTSKFTRNEANVAGLVLCFVLMGILYSMSVSVEVIVATNADLRGALYVLLVTIATTGVGGVVLIIREIESSPVVVVGIPLGILTVGLGGLILPWVIPQLPEFSFSQLFGLLLASFLGLTAIGTFELTYRRATRGFRRATGSGLEERGEDTEREQR